MSGLRIYIAARISRRHEAHALGRQLQALGHVITSRWMRPDADHVAPCGLSEEVAYPERQRFALEDLEDLRHSDCLVLMGEPARNTSRGGRLVEFGIALGLGCRVMVIGYRETVFQCLPEVEFYPTEAALIARLEKKEQEEYV